MRIVVEDKIIRNALAQRKRTWMNTRPFNEKAFLDDSQLLRLERPSAWPARPSTYRRWHRPFRY